MSWLCWDVADRPTGTIGSTGMPMTNLIAPPQGVHTVVVPPPCYPYSGAAVILQAEQEGFRRPLLLPLCCSLRSLLQLC